MSILDKAAKQAGDNAKGKQARQRQEADKAARWQKEAEPWHGLQSWFLHKLPGASDRKVLADGEARVKAVAKMLADTGQAAHLAGIADNLAEAFDRDPLAPGKLAVVELLRLALDRKAPKGTIAAELRKAGGIVWASGGRGELFNELEAVRGMLKHWHRPQAVEAKPAALAVVAKGVALRDAQFAKWYEAKGAETYHSHAAIRDRWNGMSREQQAAICPTGTGHVSRDTVIKSLERHRKRQAAKSPPSRTKAKRR